MSKTFYIAMVEPPDWLPKPVAVVGVPIYSNLFPQYQFFIHRKVDGQDCCVGEWGVSEKQTGAVVASGRTRQEAYQNFYTMCSNMDAERMDKAIQSWLGQYGSIEYAYKKGETV